MTTISVAEFFSSIFQSCDGLIELRTLTPSGKPNGRAFMSPDDVQVAVQFMKTHAADHVYFGVATRRDDTGGALENCAHLPALFVDLDFKHTPEADARRRLAECPLPPSCSVQSGGGLHVYWLLREPLDLREDSNRVMARALLRRLAQFLVADLSSAEPARVLRVPGSLNVKPDYVPPRHVVIETLAEHRYNLGEFADILPPEPKEGRTNGTTFVSPVRILDGERSNILYKTARSLKAKGLSREAMAAAVRAENGAKCEPPLSDAELEDLIVHAWTQADRPTFAAAAPETVEAKPLDTVRLTDVGNAERFTHAHRGVVHHCYPLRTWFVCTPDGLWERDAGHRVMQLAKETVRSIYDEAQHEDGDERRTKLAAHAVKSENAQRLQAMIDLARSEQGIAIAPDAFDRNPWVFSVANGVVDLTTGLLRPRQRDDLITKQSPVRFDPNATCPTWLRFLLRICQEDQSLIGYIQEIAGYCLTGLTVEQAFFLLWGSGSNGKSTLLKVLLKLFGDYGLQVPADTFLSRTQDGRATPDLARLQGARLAVAIESDEGGRLAEGTIKQMTGGGSDCGPSPLSRFRGI